MSAERYVTMCLSAFLFSENWISVMTVINARICVRYDTLENWRKTDGELMKGELVAVQNEDGTIRLMVGGENGNQEIPLTTEKSNPTSSDSKE